MGIIECQRNGIKGNQDAFCSRSREMESKGIRMLFGSYNKRKNRNGI